MTTYNLTHLAHAASLEEAKQKIIDRVIAEGDKPYVSVAEQLSFLEQLAAFDFGRFLILHQGINGFWTHYILTHPWYGKKTGLNNAKEAFTPLESFILNEAPFALATQERFLIFLKECQTQVKENCSLCAIPCGILGELFYLDFTEIQNFSITGVDIDPEALCQARQLAEEKNLINHTQLFEKSAWDITFKNQFDLIVSNGLNFYEADDTKVTALYQNFYEALKYGGKLVTSFLSPPPMPSTACEWDMSKINPAHLLKQKILLADIIQSRFQCYRSTEQTREQLKAVGFKNISFIYDHAKMFPSVVAYK